MVTEFKPSRDARVTRSRLPLSLRTSSFKSVESEVQSCFPNKKRIHFEDLKTKFLKFTNIVCSFSKSSSSSTLSHNETVTAFAPLPMSTPTSIRDPATGSNPADPERPKPRTGTVSNPTPLWVTPLSPGEERPKVLRGVGAKEDGFWAAGKYRMGKSCCVYR